MLYSGSDAKFWQHLPAVLLIHISAISREDVYPEHNREALTKFCIGSGAKHMGNEPNLHILGLSMDSVGQFERIKVINMQMHAYL